MRQEAVVANRSYYPDTSLVGLESITQPLKKQQPVSGSNLKYEPPPSPTGMSSTTHSAEKFVPSEALLQNFVL